MSGTELPVGGPLCRVSMGASASADGAGDALLEVRCEGWPDDGGEAVVVVKGDLCHYSAPQALDSLRWLANTAEVLIIDLSGVEFIDAVGIRALVELWEAVTGRGAGWELRSPSPTVRRLLELVSLDGTLLCTRSPVG